MRNTTEHARLIWLDIVRGIAIVWIFLVHFVERFMPGSFFANPTQGWPSLAGRIAQLKPLPVPGVSGFFVNALRYVGWLGDQGVQIFLVASGFVLTFTAIRKAGELNQREFYSRRFARILPLWWAIHFLFIAAWILLGEGLNPTDWRAVASFVGLRSVPQAMYYFSPAWWFIGLLLQLFLVFPYLYRFLTGTRPVRFFLIVGGISVLIRLGGLLNFNHYLDWWSRGGIFVSRLPEFAFGMAFAKLLWDNEDKFRLPDLGALFVGDSLKVFV